MLFRIAALAAACVLVYGCAGGATSAEMASDGWVTRVILGLIHGIIAPFSLLGSWLDVFAPGIIPGPQRVLQPSAADDPFYVTGFMAGLLGFWSLWWVERVRHIHVRRVG